MFEFLIWIWCHFQLFLKVPLLITDNYETVSEFWATFTQKYPQNQTVQTHWVDLMYVGMWNWIDTGSWHGFENYFFFNENDSFKPTLTARSLHYESNKGRSIDIKSRFTNSPSAITWKIASTPDNGIKYCDFIVFLPSELVNKTALVSFE